ncbi:unnamed protein product [Cylindrotheca closterium]|uniref:Uncharacterized protein n=1 Tax=Cylindrotheca closterium TaxID=2856 RepID=A0AAD2PU17_9STRA|nr:unnamed protein product [Cylindrotheca closterium]
MEEARVGGSRTACRLQQAAVGLCFGVNVNIALLPPVQLGERPVLVQVAFNMAPMNLEGKVAKQGRDGGGQVKLRARQGQMSIGEGLIQGDEAVTGHLNQRLAGKGLQLGK